MLLLIIAFGIALRTVFTLRTGEQIYEPDGLFYYAFIQQTVANHYVFPKVDALSSFPVHMPFSERPGLVYMVTVPFYFLHSFLSIPDIMDLMVVVFGIIGILIAYKFSLELSGGNTPTGLLGAFLFATLPAAIAKNMSGVYRGDSFVPIMLAGSLLLVLMAYKSKNKIKQAAYIIFSILIIIAAYYIWSAAIYAAIVYIFALVLLCLYWIMDKILSAKSYGKYKKYTMLIVLICAALLIAVGWEIFLNFPAISVITQFGSYFTKSSLPIYTTTSELQSPSFLYWIANYLFAIFIMWAVIVGFLFMNRKGEQTMAYLLLLAILLVGIPPALSQERWGILIAMPVAVLAAPFIQVLYSYKDKFAISEKKINQLFFLIIIVCIAAPLYQFVLLKPIAEASPSYHLAMDWIQNHTDANATFLTFWDDGSAIEGWAQRQSFTDSVEGEHYTNIVAFAHFLAAPAGNFSYLKQVHPDYLLTRRYWLNESNILLYQGGLSIDYNIKGTNFELLVNQTPSTVNSSNGSIILTRVYQTINDTIYKISYG